MAGGYPGWGSQEGGKPHLMGPFSMGSLTGSPPRLEAEGPHRHIRQLGLTYPKRKLTATLVRINKIEVGNVLHVTPAKAAWAMQWGGDAYSSP